jgi:uncharacterized protein with PIN domain
VYQFPSPADRRVAEAVVGEMARNRCIGARIRAQKVLRTILDRYGITKMHLENCTVTACRTPKFAGIAAKKQITGDRCPGCGARIYDLAVFEGGRVIWPEVRIAGIEEGFKRDRVTYVCTCGEIFWKEESKEDEEAGESG